MRRRTRRRLRRTTTLGIEDEPNGGVSVLQGDSDPEGGALRVVAFTQGEKGSVNYEPGHPTDLHYTAQPNAFGSDSFTYTVEDPEGASASATVHVTIYGVQDPPFAGDDTATVFEDETSSLCNLYDNDGDPDGEPFWIGVLKPAHGQLTSGGQCLTYRPAPNFSGTDSSPTRSGTARTSLAQRR